MAERDVNSGKYLDAESAVAGSTVFYQNGPNGLPVYVKQGANGEDVYFQIDQNGQVIFLKLQNPQNAAKVAATAESLKNTDVSAPVKKKKKKRRFLLFALEVILLLILAAGLYVAASLSRIERIKIQDEEIKQEVEEQLSSQTVEKLQGYWNIALYGVDSRETSENGQSDTIIVCSINKDTKEVRLASVYRDTYLESDGSYKKATDVYGGYGVDRSIRMLNKNLDLDISDFITVNMNIVADMVNAVGGIEIDVREDEVVHLNNYQVEGSEITGLEIIPVESAGLQTLNGLQALSYCRIRYTAPIDSEHPGLDYERTIRQRRVLEKILEKVKKMDYVGIVGLVNELLPNVATSLSQSEVLSLAKDVAAYTLVGTVGWPYDKVTGDTGAGDCVIPVNLANNVIQLHQFLFNDMDYEVSPTVQEISDNIAYNTGVY